MDLGRSIDGISRTPVAICKNTLVGLPVCRAGWNGMCHSTNVCTEQMDLEDPKKRTIKAEALHMLESEDFQGMDQEEVIKHLESIIRSDD